MLEEKQCFCLSTSVNMTLRQACNMIRHRTSEVRISKYPDRGLGDLIVTKLPTLLRKPDMHLMKALL